MSTIYRPYIVHELAAIHPMIALFDQWPDVVFSIKDACGRYSALSEGCAGRGALRNQWQAVGRTVHELFPEAMAARYHQQDQTVFRGERPVLNRLDLTVYRNGDSGWCLSNKQSVYRHDGELLGLVCISRDLTELTREKLIDERFALCVDYIQQHFDQTLYLEQLSALSGLSIGQLDRRMKRVFQCSTGEFIRRTRIEAACHAIVHGRLPLADIALRCGFFDQSALCRHCRQLLGLSPRQLRQRQIIAG